jgi:hypothetical protein
MHLSQVLARAMPVSDKLRLRGIELAAGVEAARRRAQAQERASKQASKRETTLESTNQ